MARHLTIEHDEQFSNSLTAQWKFFRNFVNQYITSTVAIAELKLADRTYATTDKDRADSLNKFLGFVFTNETREEWHGVKRHVNKTSDDLNFTAELVFEEVTAQDANKFMGSDNYNHGFFLKHGIKSLRHNLVFQNSWDLS